MLRNVALLVLAAAPMAAADKPAPRRVVNLDLPPSQRWAELAKEFQAPMRLTLDYVHNKSQSAIIAPIIKQLKDGLRTGGGWTDDWIAEMHGLADAGGVNDRHCVPPAREDGVDFVLRGVPADALPNLFRVDVLPQPRKASRFC